MKSGGNETTRKSTQHLNSHSVNCCRNHQKHTCFATSSILMNKNHVIQLVCICDTKINERTLELGINSRQFVDFP